MRKSKCEGYTQSYNAQAVVDADGSQLIVGQRVSTPSASLRALSLSKRLRRRRGRDCRGHPETRCE